MRQPSYQGFLSVEMVGKDSQPLWSYLVTPSKFPTKSITEDLADNMVKELAAALEEKSQRVPKSTADAGAIEGILNAAGTAFPALLYQEWFQSFQQRYPNLHVTYSAVGSEAGIEMLTHGKLDFAASDMPPSDDGMPESKTALVHFAMALGAVVPIYNLKSLDQNLNFTGEILSGIYLGQIKSWNDPKIRKPNQNVRLPDSPIVVIHRSDDSGASFLEGVEGDEAIANLVQKTPNSIGYVGWVYGRVVCACLDHPGGHQSARSRA